MKLNLFFILFTLISSAQVGGEHVYSFLNFSTSARQTALGGSVLTFTDNVNQPIWNPASINDEMDAKVALNYVNYLTEINYISAAYAHTVNNHVGTFHSGLTYLNYGTFIAADEQGNETGTFKAYDMAFSVGYAYQIPKTDIHLGSNLKLINSVIENYTSLGIALDLGAMYYNENKPYRFAAVVRNAGIQLASYDGTKESLPLQIQAGGSYQLEHVPIRLYATLDNLQRWQLATFNPSDATTDFFGNVTKEDPTFVDNTLRHFVIGAELFPERGFSLRIGYNAQRAKELSLKDVRSFAGLSFGFGLKVKRIKLNYAYSKFHPFADNHSFGMILNLN